MQKTNNINLLYLKTENIEWKRCNFRGTIHIPNHIFVQLIRWRSPNISKSFHHTFMQKATAVHVISYTVKGVSVS